MIRLLLCDMPLDGLDACLGELAAAAREEPDRRSFLIVPEEAKADAERRYLERFDRQRGLMMAEVLSFRRFAHRVFSDLGGLAACRLSNAGKALLISRLLSEDRAAFPYLGRLGGKSAYAAELSQILGDFARYGLSAEDLRAAAAKTRFPQLSQDKFRDLALLKERYEAELKRRGLFDGDADFPRLCRLLRDETQHPRLAYLKSARIWAAGFGLLRAFTPQERELLVLLGQTAADLSLAVCAGRAGQSSETPPEAEKSLPREERAGRYYAFKTLAQLRQLFPKAEERRLPSASRGPARIELWRSEESRSEAAALAGEIRFLLPKDGGLEAVPGGKTGSAIPYSSGPVLQGEPLRRRDIAIAAAKSEDSERLREVLADFGLDAFISEARPLHESPLFRYLEAFFRLAGGHGEIRDLIALGRSSLLSLEADALDRFENFLLASPFRYLSELSQERSYRLQPEAWGFYQEVFAPQMQAASALRSEKSAAAKARCLLRWLDKGAAMKARLQQQIEALEAASQSELALLLARSWDTVLTLLEDAIRLLGESPLSIRDFSELCLSALRGQRPAGIPMGLDRIRLGSPAQLLLYPARVLFLCGADAASFPPPLPAEGLLRNAEREGLEEESTVPLPNYRRDAVKAGICLSYFLSRLPSDRLILSCPSLEEDDGADLLLHLEKGGQPPSPAPRVQRCFSSLRQGSLPDVRFLSPAFARRALGPRRPDEATWKRIWRELLGAETNSAEADPLDRPAAHLQLSPPAAAAFLDAASGFSVTRLQSLRACPYQHFTAYGLELSERLLFQPDPRYRGSFLHAMMEASLGELLRKSAELEAEKVPEVNLKQWIESWKNGLDQDYVGRLYNELAERPAFRNYGAAELRGGEGFRLRRAARDCLLDTAAFLSAEAALPRHLEWFFPQKDQPPFLLRNGDRAFPLRGVIDRIDLKADGSALLLDYKSGSKKLSYPAMAAGLDLQLPLYAAVYRQAEPERELQGLGFFRLAAHSAEKFTDSAARRKAAAADASGESQLMKDPAAIQLVSRYAGRVAERLLQQLADGEISARPLKLKDDLPCRYCPASAICRDDPRSRAARCRSLPELEQPGKKAGEDALELMQRCLDEDRLPREEASL